MAKRREKKRLAVVALGGHCLTHPDQEGTIGDQEKNAEEVCSRLISIIQAGYNLVISHGNGPQVGEILIQNEFTKDISPPMPLDVCVAFSEGSMGYIMQQALLNQLRRNNLKNYVVTLITQVLVDKNDPAFQKPTKPIGPFFTRTEAEKRQKERNWIMVEDSGRGFRRVVSSPRPVKIIQSSMIRDLALQGNVVIALGGGGIPIWLKPDGNYEGIEAVIDKDLASGKLAREIGADLLIILTEVPKVCLFFNTDRQQELAQLSLQNAKRYLNEGHFPPGNMGPKIEGAIDFLSNGEGKEAIITIPEFLEEALSGKEGTHIVPE